tara:strand:+ start:702 stop:1184 length:483 start_codon:yes stop_codon:yes gene_type:complete
MKGLVDYSRGFIYKLCCKNPEITDIYVGSSTNFLNRKSAHRRQSLKPYDKKYDQLKYRFIREHGGFENWDMIVIEDYPCETKRQLETRERFYIEDLKASLNITIPTRSKQEYRQINRERLNKCKREKIQCHCGCIVSKNNFQRHVQTKRHKDLLCTAVTV